MIASEAILYHIDQSIDTTMDLRRLIFLLLSLASFAPNLSQAIPTTTHVDFDLLTDTHDDLYGRLHKLLKKPSDPPYDPTNVLGRYVLGPRRPDFYGEPLQWIMVHVVAGEEDGMCTLALAADDVYLIGFANRTGDWHIVDGFQGLPNATTLPIGSNYLDLVDGGHKNFWKVPLGKQSAIDAFKRLASYNPAATSPEQVKQAVARFTVMVTEAMRFTKIRETLKGELWEKETFISKEQAEYVVHWGILSYLLVEWKRSGYENWEGMRADAVQDSIGVNNGIDAWEIVDFLVRQLDIVPPTTSSTDSRRSSLFGLLVRPFVILINNTTPV